MKKYFSPFTKRLLTALLLFAALHSQSQSKYPDQTYLVEKLSTGFYVPPRVGGDKDFGGHGPNVTCNVTLWVSVDKRQLIARVTMDAKETQNDWTECRGTTDMVIFTCRAGQTIKAVSTPTISNCRYTDRNHEDDFVVGGRTATTSTGAQATQWALYDNNPADLVAFYRFVGDVDGDDAGVRTGVQVYFNPISITTSGTPMNEIKLNAPTGFGICGNNTCASSASACFLNFYHIPRITCEYIKSLYDNPVKSPNISSVIKSLTGDNIGVDPNTVRDRLREIKSTVTMEEINNATVIDRIKTLILMGKPVITLTGWGSKTVLDFYARADDNVSLNPNSVLHYIVVDGFNPQTNVFFIVDNGSRKCVSAEYLRNIILWHPENLAIEASLYGAQTKPGKIIY